MYLILEHLTTTFPARAREGEVTAATKMMHPNASGQRFL